MFVRIETMGLRFALVCAVALASLAGCGGSPPSAEALPPMPSIRTEAFPAATREQLQSRLTAVQGAPDNPHAVGGLAMLLHAHQQHETARAVYRRAAALEPDALRWRYYLGVTQAELGDVTGAIESFREALRIDEAFAPARRRLADASMQANSLDEAARAYQDLLLDDPADAAARFGLGRALAARGDTAGAIDELSEAVRLLPEYGAAHYELSLAYRDAEQPDKAQSHLRLYQQAQAAPRFDDPLMAAVEALAQGAGDHIRRGVELEARGDLEGAVETHLKALEIDPEVAQAHVNLVSLYGRLGRFDQAARHYERALALNPGQADLHYNHGVLLYSQGRFPEARRAFEKTLEVSPGHAEAHNNLGQILESERRIDEAAAHYRAAVEAQPRYRLARFHLGRMLLAKRQPVEAAEHLERAIEPRDEMTPQVVFALATARAQSGDNAEALRLGEQARLLAQQMGQDELARRIEQDLAKIR